MAHDHNRDREPLVSLRTLVILSLATLIAISAGALTLASGSPLPQAALAAGAAFAGTSLFLHQVTQ
jgi:hypothetical protein